MKKVSFTDEEVLMISTALCAAAADCARLHTPDSQARAERYVALAERIEKETSE